MKLHVHRCMHRIACPGSTAQSITRMLVRVVFWLMLGSGFLLTSVAIAQGPLKIGFVNASTILEKAPQAEEARKRLEQEFEKRDLAMVEAQKTVRDLEDRLIDEGSEIGDNERRKLEREIRNQKRDLKRMEEEFKEDFNLRRNEELGKLQRLVYAAIVDLAKTEEFDLIVNQDSVIFASERVDITEKVLKRLQ